MPDYVSLVDTLARLVLAMRDMQRWHRTVYPTPQAGALVDLEKEVDSLVALHLSQPPTTADANSSPPTGENGSGLSSSPLSADVFESRFRKLMRLVQTLIDLHAAPMSFRNPRYYEQRIDAMDALRAFMVTLTGDQLHGDQGAEGGAA